MINQKGSKKVRMGFWLLKLLPRDIKAKTKNKQNNQKRYQKK